MCCAFNKEEADKIFVESNYTYTLKDFNDFEKNSSIGQKFKPLGMFQITYAQII
jgi:hypothetical protein